MSSTDHPPTPPAPAGPAPRPPDGPGVQPPFSAPPRDQNRRGLWIGLALGAVASVVCCVGGVAGFGLLALGSAEQLSRAATATVTSYYQALEDKDYLRAYGYLCRDLTRRLTPDEYATLERGAPGVLAFQVGKPMTAPELTVPVHVEYADGTDGTRQVELTQEQAASQTLRVCGRP